MRSIEWAIGEHRPGPFEAAVFGTEDVSAIAERFASITEVATGRSIDAALWYQSSAAAVCAVVLDDGENVVVRAYQPRTSRTFIDAIVRLQVSLHHRGVPCAEPIGLPAVVDGVLWRVESLLDDPGMRTFTASEMQQSAEGLASVVRATAGLDSSGLDRHPMALSTTDLYPEPHSPIFDFAGTSEGAEWIDEIAAAARSAMTETELVIAHHDWSARNVRLGPDGLVAAFDWESLQLNSEASAVGVAAATWPSTGHPNDPIAPSGPEIARYIDLYEAARGAPLDEDQHRSARAAAVFALSYTARCEHALTPGTRSGRASSRLAAEPDLGSLLS